MAVQKSVQTSPPPLLSPLLVQSTHRSGVRMVEELVMRVKVRVD